MAQRIQPDFLPSFDCKRGECRRTCCRDWEVVLTAEELESAMCSEPETEAHSLAARSLIANPNSTGDQDSGLAKMREDGLCALLTEDRLCGWKVLQGKGLCATCDDFPNIRIAFLDDEYVFPSLSCEAIVELLLGRVEPLRLAEEPIAEKSEKYHASIEKEHFARRPLLEIYPDLMRLGFALLQNRHFSLDERMVLLANGLSLVDWLERNGRAAEVREAMERFATTENLEKTLAKFAEYTFGPRAVLTICGNTLLSLLNHSAYGAEAKRILHGLGFGIVEVELNGETAQRLELADSERYLRRKESLKEFLREQETLFEHAMVCLYLRSMMPVARGSVWENFMFFNVCYALLKGVLVGSFEAAPGDAELVEAVVVLHRMFIHDYDARQRTIESLAEMKHNDLLSMVALVKG